MKMPSTDDYVTLRTTWSFGFAEYSGLVSYEDDGEIMKITGLFHSHEDSDLTHGEWVFEPAALRQHDQQVIFVNHTYFHRYTINDMVAI